mgnify:FL=1
MEFTPEIHQHSAGLIMYYDNMNYVNLRKYYSETLGQSALSIIQLENGEKTEFFKHQDSGGRQTDLLAALCTGKRILV